MRLLELGEDSLCSVVARLEGTEVLCLEASCATFRRLLSSAHGRSTWRALALASLGEPLLLLQQYAAVDANVVPDALWHKQLYIQSQALGAMVWACPSFVDKLTSSRLPGLDSMPGFYPSSFSRSGHSATVLPDSSLLVIFGGVGMDGGWYAHVRSTSCVRHH